MGFKYLLTYLYKNFHTKPVAGKTGGSLFISAIDGNYLIYDIILKMNLTTIRQIAQYFVERCFQQTRRVHRLMGKHKEMLQIIVIDGKAPKMKQRTQELRRQTGTGSEIRQLLSSKKMMHEFQSQVAEFIAEGEIDTIFDSSISPGEGEHKVLKHVLTQHCAKNSSICFFSGDSDMIVLCLANLGLFASNQVWVQIMYARYNCPIFDIRDLNVQLLKRYNVDSFIPVFTSWLLIGNDFLPPLLSFSNPRQQSTVEAATQNTCQTFETQCKFAFNLLARKKIDFAALFFLIKWCTWYYIEQYNCSDGGGKKHIVNCNPLDGLTNRDFRKTQTVPILDELIQKTIEKLEYNDVAVYSNI
jgi:hypothetical protein